MNCTGGCAETRVEQPLPHRTNPANIGILKGRRLVII